MTIYDNPRRKNSNYRKIYERHYGPIPVDDTGRTYDIHHIDGNHNNNDPVNLKAVSIQDHYDIHYAQKDWGAVGAIALRMAVTPEELSEIGRRREKDRVENGTHPWQGNGEVVRLRLIKMVEDGTHPWLGPDHNRKQLANGTHPSQNDELRAVARERTLAQLADGKHPFCSSEFATQRNLRLSAEGRNPLQGGEIQRRTSIARLQAGTHPSQVTRTCNVCGTEGRSPGIFRHHFANCRYTSNKE